MSRLQPRWQILWQSLTTGPVQSWAKSWCPLTIRSCWNTPWKLQRWLFCEISSLVSFPQRLQRVRGFVCPWWALLLSFHSQYYSERKRSSARAFLSRIRLPRYFSNQWIGWTPGWESRLLWRCLLWGCFPRLLKQLCSDYLGVVFAFQDWQQLWRANGSDYKLQLSSEWPDLNCWSSKLADALYSSLRWRWQHFSSAAQEIIIRLLKTDLCVCL